MVKFCEYCGNEFETLNPRRLFCCPRCRRSADNERKRDRRAEEAEARAEFVMDDPWEWNHLPDDVTENTLLDGWTEACEPESYQPITTLSCDRCPHWVAREKSVRRRRNVSIDLVCEMCRSGCRV